ncbi:ATP-dependent helicase, partial [Pseudomonas congelans]
DPALEGVGLLIFDEFHIFPQSLKPHISCQAA